MSLSQRKTQVPAITELVEHLVVCDRCAAETPVSGFEARIPCGDWMALAIREVHGNWDADFCRPCAFEVRRAIEAVVRAGP